MARVTNGVGLPSSVTETILMKRYSSIAAIAALAVLLPVVASAQDDGQRESPGRRKNDSIRRWIQELDSDNFAARETATHNLIDAGSAATSSLANTAAGESAEARWRVMVVLKALCRSDHRPTQAAAVSALEQVARSPNHTVASLAARVLRAHRQAWRQRAIAEIRKLGGGVSIESGQVRQVRLGSNWKGAESGLANLRAIPELNRLDLGNSKIDGSGLVHLKSLNKLSYLSLKHLRIDGAALRHLAGLTQLESLGLDDTPVTDAAIAHLKCLTKLKVLWLNRSHVTDAGLRHLKGLKNLTKLDLSGTRIAGPGLVHLKDLANLRFVSLQYVKLGDSALKYLSDLKQLESLGLDDTLVSDAGVVHLEGLSNLKVLWLTNTQISDAALPHLKKLTNLQKLYLEGTKITKAGITELEKALPDCRLIR